MKGKVIIFSAPSGSGKTTIVKEMLKDIPQLAFSISACSRSPRNAERNGKDYYFLSEEDFRKKISNNEFLEWEEVYKGSLYGTLFSEIERVWAQGKTVVFDVDVIGGLNIKKHFKENALALFIQTPSIEILKKRLIARGSETEESLKSRLDKAEYELSFASKFDTRIINDELDEAFEQTKKSILQFIKS